MKIRTLTISFSVNKVENRKRQEKALVSDIIKLEEIINKYPSTDSLTELENKKQTLEEIRRDKIKGVMFRSKASWYEDGEKNTNYFCNLEKRNYINKTISELITESGSVLDDVEDILQEEANFFGDLYKSDRGPQGIDNSDFFNHTVKLNEGQKRSCEGLLNLDELAKALKHMDNGSPGSDGFGAEFYKFFWRDLGTLLCRSVNYAYENGKLSDFQCQGIITCLPKEGRDRRYIKKMETHIVTKC